MSYKVILKTVCSLVIIMIFVSLGADKIINNQQGANVFRKTASNDVTIRFMSNLPNRTYGQGKIEQLLADRYVEEHPNVKIEFETLQDVAFQQRFKIYIASNHIPDVYMNWVSSLDFLDKTSAELNKSDFDGYGFMPGALETRMKNGKLYGIPNSNDFYLLYYNKEIFKRFDLKVPKSFQELLQVTKQLRSNGIIPCATNGKEKWELSGIYTDLYFKIKPDPIGHISNWNNTSYSKDPAELKAAQYYKQLMNTGFFQDNFAIADYASAKDLFIQGKAAMYYMGTWELGMTNDTSLPEEFKKNLAAISMPSIDGENGGNKVLANWYGGGYSVGKDSKVKSEAIDFLKYYFKPENWAQLVWDNGICIAPQLLKSTDSENELMKSVYDILLSTEKFLGQESRPNSAGTFSMDGRDDLYLQFSIGKLTPEQFINAMDEGLRKGFEEESRTK